MDGGRVELLTLLGNGAEDLGAGDVVPEVIFNSLPDLKRDGRDHILYAPIKIFAVQVTYMETISFSVPNPSSCKSLDPIGDFKTFCCYQVI